MTEDNKPSAEADEIKAPKPAAKEPVAPKIVDADEINARQAAEAKKAGKEYQGRESETPRGDL